MQPIAPSRRPRLAVAALLAVCLGGLLLPAAAEAQPRELYTFSAAALGGVGGSVDAEPGDDLGNPGFQLNLTMVTEAQTHVGFRLGQIDLGGDDEPFGPLFGADLTYATLAGEYRFRHSYYESGIYLGLGGYRLEGTSLTGTDADETSPGVVVGVTGEFPITPWLGVLVELSGHWADFDDQQVFGMGHAGVVFHW